MSVTEQGQRHPERAAESERGEAGQDAAVQQPDANCPGDDHHTQQHVGRPGPSGAQHSLLQL